MLSQKIIDIVKSTAPVLQEHGEALTKHFYKRMFSHNPEVAPFFNPANQSEGTQQRALAGAIAAYAANIDNLDVLSDAVKLIAHKHASLQVKPEHYPIVGENLLASIREVLGDAATDDIINAWSEAYGFLADILIGCEKEIYEKNAQKLGGWEGFKSFKIQGKETESTIITSFYLKPEDGEPIPNYLPGQYITVRVATPDGSTTMRNYSLSDKPNQAYLRISVKRESNTPKGYVSNKLHDAIKVGDTIEVGAPCGDFFLDIEANHKRPLVLLAAGIGITPLLSILKATLDQSPDRKVTFIHGCLNKDVHAFKKTIDKLATTHANLDVHYRYSNSDVDNTSCEDNCSTGFIDAHLINSLVSNRDADYYFCGPKPFMISMYQIINGWNIPSSQIYFEFFGPKEELETTA